MTCLVSDLSACRLYQCNVCGEGGEYESLVLDCPFFKKARIVLDQWTCILHSPDIFSPVGLLQPIAFHLEAKSGTSAAPQSTAEQTSCREDEHLGVQPSLIRMHQGFAAEQPPEPAHEQSAVQQSSSTAHSGSPAEQSANFVDGQSPVQQLPNLAQEHEQSAVQQSSHVARQHDQPYVQQPPKVAGQHRLSAMQRSSDVAERHKQAPQASVLTPAAAESLSAQQFLPIPMVSSLVQASVIEVPQDFPAAVQTAVKPFSTPSAVPATVEGSSFNGEDCLAERNMSAEQQVSSGHTDATDAPQHQHGQEPSSSQAPQAASASPKHRRDDDAQSRAVVEQNVADDEQGRADAEQDRPVVEQGKADAEQDRADAKHGSPAEDLADCNTSSASAISAANSSARAQHEPSMSLAWDPVLFRPYDYASNMLLQQGAAYVRALCIAKRGPNVAEGSDTTAATLDHALQVITTGIHPL